MFEYDPLKEIVPEWTCRKEFAECFYDLERVSEGRREYLLKDLAESIDGEVSRQTREFEAFGIKFPTEDLARWGMVLIIATLLYFSLHLRELSPKITASDAGLEVAWLGLYSSWYSYGLLWLSILVVPCTAVILLGLRGARYRGPLGSALKTAWRELSLWIAIPTLVCCALAAVSCLSAMRLASLAATARQESDKPDEPC